MIVLSNPVAQVVPAGQSVTFTNVILHTGHSECYQNGSGSVILNAKCGMYDIYFGGNIGATEEGTAQLAISLSGSPLMLTTMLSQTAAAGDLNSVSRSTSIKTCCCGGEYVTVVNTGTTDINLGENPVLKIKRVA